jgi:hypothetical protein
LHKKLENNELEYRGANSDKKWDALSNKIEESGCDIVCLQETKREHFDLKYIKNFCPKKFNKFVFLPSVGASGGTIIIWNDALFSGEQLFQNDFSILVKFTCNLSGNIWILTSIYGPCHAEGKYQFIDWFGNIDMLMTLIGLSWGISISSGIPLTEISRVGILMKC